MTAAADRAAVAGADRGIGVGHGGMSRIDAEKRLQASPALGDRGVRGGLEGHD